MNRFLKNDLKLLLMFSCGLDLHCLRATSGPQARSLKHKASGVEAYAGHAGLTVTD